MIALCTPSVWAQIKNSEHPITGYAPVNGLKMYYEIHGAGKPLILLHGSHATAATTFGGILPELKKHYKVIAVEMQGHGHTADINRPISCSAMAEDVSAFIKFLKLEKVDILGYSMGSGVALNLAVRHPDQVGKMVLLSPVYKATGIQPAYWPMLPQITPEVFKGSPVKLAYDSVAPNPKNWPVLVDKLKTLYSQNFDWDQKKIGAIKSPVMVIVGDADMVKPEHAVELFRLFGGGQFGDLQGLPNSELAVLPSTGHVGLLFRTDWLLAMIQPFLNKQTN
ncbi:alpha/beta hydrolase fold protein [Pedobacter heparinus DSM 2366]|uniref:Alpha/beta hydrolase fold protein n=2 Tax=Pedobacter heparinus TaxID=984 RepID=C6XVD1_PEDHD|nr:alpha/beta hydrolase fold protein [Pedobacter heparinus DSM 2366]